MERDITVDELVALCREKEAEAKKAYAYNRKQIAKIYATEFTLIEGYLDFSLELGQMLDSLIPAINKPFLQFALLRIHERSIKVLREAKILLENGSGSGAMARWRTLFEFSVVANYLMKYPNTAEKYIMYSYVDDYKYSRRLVENRDRLKLHNFNMDAFPQIEEEYRKVKEKYGWTGKNSYEWAKTDEVKKPDLLSLATAVDADHLYAYVCEAHLYNHPSMRYLINDRGGQNPNNENEKALFSPFGIELPCALLVCSMHQVNGMALLGYCNLEAADPERILFYSNMNKSFPEVIIKIAEEKRQQEATTHAD